MSSRATTVALAVALVCMPSSGASAMDFVFLAFGDSITRSSGCPVNCGAQFDEEGLDGYVGRLDTRLGAGYKVENHGFGGETTAEGLTRIDSVLAGGGDVLLLMEGTNDITSGFSTESIKANLEEMIDKATAQGVDTVLASTIRRMNLPGHNPTSDLRSAIDNLAADKDRDFVNPFGPLCPIQACFDEHYDQSDQEIGHVDASGYEIMTDLWEDVIRADTAPAKPTTVAPKGEIVVEKPTYEWNEAARANWYQVQVDDGGGVILDTMVDATTECSGGTCTVSPGQALADGDYEWRVRARNLIGYGSWSNWTSFTVSFVLPGPVTLIAPSGNFYSVSPITFLYEWDEALDSDEYELRVEDSTGARPINEIYPASVCDAGGVCDAMPGTALGAGDYLWKVRGLNGVGKGLWSPTLSVGIYSSAPGGVNKIFPDGDTFDTEPTYRWKEVPGATGYDLQVDEVGGGTVLERSYDGSKCHAGICSVTPTVTLSIGTTYKWRLRASNPLGEGNWTGFTNFEVLPCSNPVDVTITAQTITGEETFSACGTLTVADGVLVTSTAKVTLHAGDDVVLEDGIEIEDGAEVTVRIDL